MSRFVPYHAIRVLNPFAAISLATPQFWVSLGNFAGWIYQRARGLDVREDAGAVGEGVG